VIAGYNHFLFKNKTIFSVSINMAVAGFEVGILPVRCVSTTLLVQWLLALLP
jgi:hypothetical protein